MPATLLPDRGVLRIQGNETLDFLQGLITCNVADLAPGEARFGALLTPQGKVLSDFFVTHLPIEAGPGVLLDVPQTQAADLFKRLKMYKLRAKLDLSDLSETHAVAASWQDETALPGLTFDDPRAPGLGRRIIAERQALASLGSDDSVYHAHRIALAVPEGGRDYAFADAFPHEADMDQLGGIDFKKGCYVGQEVVSRMQHRGTARNRIVAVRADRPIPGPSGNDITAGETRLGTLGSSAGNRALATIRIDRLGDALAQGGQPQVAGVPVTIEKPAWATFDFPGQ